MQTFHKLIHAFWLLLVLAMFSACNRHFTFDVSRTNSHFSSHVRESSPFCGLPRGTIEGRGSGGVRFPDSPDAANRVVAGFSSIFEGGAPPIPCNRLSVIAQSGRFLFDVRGIRAEEVRWATVRIKSVEPIGENIIRWAVPWGSGSGEGHIGEPGGIRRECSFQVRKIVTPPGPEDWRWSSYLPDSRYLSAGAQTFTVPNGDPVYETVNVTEEVHSQLSSGRPVEFIVVAVDPGMDYQSNSRWYGYLTIELFVETR